MAKNYLLVRSIFRETVIKRGQIIFSCHQIFYSKVLFSLEGVDLDPRLSQ